MIINEIKQWFELAIPNPTKANQRVQIGCHAEEFCEMLDTITGSSKADEDDSRYDDIIENTNACLGHLADKLKKNTDFEVGIIDRQELLDALADQIVTATGVAHMYGFDILGALAEVSRSNNSKFVDGKPVFNEHGKITKGPNYTPPDLTNFLGTDPVA